MLKKYIVMKCKKVQKIKGNTKYTIHEIPI